MTRREPQKGRWTEVNQSLGGLSLKCPLRLVLKMTRESFKGKEGGNSIPEERRGHSLGADATPQEQGCVSRMLTVAEGGTCGREGVVRKGSTVSGWDVLSHRRQCCAGSEAEPCRRRELWGHFWDS